jgi:hypothetical protein
MWVGRGGFWEWEERRRVSEELEGKEAEFGLEESEEWGDLSGVSRTGSLRSVRSGRSSLRGARGRREASVESVRSYTSTVDGLALTPTKQFEWDTVARSLLADDWEDEDEEVEEKIRQANPTVSSGTPSPPKQSRYPSSTSLHSHHSSHTVEEPPIPPPTRFYPSTSTPVQYFLSYDPPFLPIASSAASADTQTANIDTAEQHIVPISIRALIQRMTSPKEADRPTAKEVREELERIAAAEGVEL